MELGGCEELNRTYTQTGTRRGMWTGNENFPRFEVRFGCRNIMVDLENLSKPVIFYNFSLMGSTFILMALKILFYGKNERGR